MSGDSNTRPKRTAASQAGDVPDLEAKLDYLVRVRGDRRRGAAARNRRVTSKPSLAVELGVDNATIWRWEQGGRIPNLALHAPMIAAIFDCDEQSFRRDDLATFAAKCEGGTVGWGRLLSRAVIDLSAIRPVPSLRKADLAGGLQDRDLPIVEPGQAFEVEFPGGAAERAPAHWAGWHVLMFNGDRDGYLNWLPRHKATQEFGGLDRFPRAARSIVAPRAGGRALTAGETAWGEHDVVLVVSRDPIPTELEAELMKPLLNAALQPALDELARWVMPRLDLEPEPEAAILRGLFFIGTQGERAGKAEPAS